MRPDHSLVPPARLGALLTEQRTSRGLTIDELRAAGGVGFSAEELRRVEQGELVLSDDQVHRLMTAYQVTSGPLVPDRSELIVDLYNGAVFAGSRTKVLPEGATLDDVLGRYLSLLYLMRGLEPGHKLPLRDGDLGVLSDALDQNLTEIEHRLFELMLAGEVLPWFSRVQHRLAVPAAGLLVGLTTVGSLVLVQMPDGERGELQASGTGQAVSAVVDEVAMAAVDVGVAELAPAVAVLRGEVDGSNSGGVVYEPGSPDSVGAAAASLIDYDYRSALVDWTVSFEGARDGYRGNTNTVTRTISIYVSMEDTPTGVAEVLAHEVGHAIDVMYLSDADRTQWMDQRDIDGSWWPTSGASDFSAGAGDFAEAVAAAIVGSPSDSSHGEFTALEIEFVISLLP